MYAIVAVMLTAKKKLNTIKKHRVHDKDTGSPEVQVAILTRKINDLASHLKKNHKDNHSRRGLLQMVANRHSHMKYLKKKSEKRYKKLSKELGIK
jgi:small subunit ribosomal protein S15